MIVIREKERKNNNTYYTLCDNLEFIFNKNDAHRLTSVT